MPQFDFPHCWKADVEGEGLGRLLCAQSKSFSRFQASPESGRSFDDAAKFVRAGRELRGLVGSGRSYWSFARFKHLFSLKPCHDVESVTLAPQPKRRIGSSAHAEVGGGPINPARVLPNQTGRSVAYQNALRHPLLLCIPSGWKRIELAEPSIPTGLDSHTRYCGIVAQ